MTSISRAWRHRELASSDMTVAVGRGGSSALLDMRGSLRADPSAASTLLLEEGQHPRAAVRGRGAVIADQLAEIALRLNPHIEGMRGLRVFDDGQRLGRRSAASALPGRRPIVAPSPQFLTMLSNFSNSSSAV